MAFSGFYAVLGLLSVLIGVASDALHAAAVSASLTWPLLAADSIAIGAALLLLIAGRRIM